MKLEEAFNYPEFLEAGEALVIETLVSFAVYCAESHMHTWRISVTIANSFCSQFLQNSHEAASRVFPVFLDIFLRLIFVSCVWAFCLHVACVLRCWAISPATSEQFSIGSAIFKSSCPPESPKYLFPIWCKCLLREALRRKCRGWRDAISRESHHCQNTVEQPCTIKPARLIVGHNWG